MQKHFFPSSPPLLQSMWFRQLIFWSDFSVSVWMTRYVFSNVAVLNVCYRNWGMLSLHSLANWSRGGFYSCCISLKFGQAHAEWASAVSPSIYQLCHCKEPISAPTCDGCHSTVDELIGLIQNSSSDFWVLCNQLFFGIVSLFIIRL